MKSNRGDCLNGCYRPATLSPAKRSEQTEQSEQTLISRPGQLTDKCSTSGN